MTFSVDGALLAAARARLAALPAAYWLLGGAGAGKTTVCRELAARWGFQVYDMDAHVYGDYHGRFDPIRHPVNTAWARAENGLAWLLSLSWDEFHAFNQAALPEYLDLLADDLPALPALSALREGSVVEGARQAAVGSVVIDGGISTPALLARVWPVERLACIAPARRPTSAAVWEGSAERLEMKAFVEQTGLPAAWARFLEFDERLTDTILAESVAAGLPIYAWDGERGPAEVAGRIAAGFHRRGTR